MSHVEVPQNIVNLINDRAGKEHTAEGQVLSTMAECLELYERSRPRLIATEDTLFKVYDSLIKAGLDDRAAMGALHDMQNRGIYFRELAE